jgi:hypothetical protein
MSVPTTLAALREYCGEPRMPLDDCAICKPIPKYCYRFEKGGDVEHDDTPATVAQLVSFMPAIRAMRGEVLCCPTCLRIYFHEYEYEFLVGGSEDTYSYNRLDPEELFHSEWYVRQRISAEHHFEQQRYFKHHSFVRIDGTYYALDNDGNQIKLTGGLAAFNALVASDPPDFAKRPEAYLKLADRMTSDWPYGLMTITDFDDIPWRKPLTDEDRRLIEDLRGASRVDRERIEKDGDRVVWSRWIVAHQKLVYRFVTLMPSGELKREDAVVGDGIPTHLGKRWEYNHARRRSEPVE